jgi:hypothetical protein
MRHLGTPLGGFTLRENGLWLSDNTVNNATAAKHGLCPKIGSGLDVVSGVLVATGGGSSTADPDAPPASPSTYDDEFNAGALDGKWAWNNQGGATTTFTNGYMALQMTANGANNLRSILQTIAGGDTAWTITVNMSAVFSGSGTIAAIVLTDGTKFEVFDYSWPSSAGDQPLRIHTFATNASAGTLIASYQAPMRGYLRVQCDGTSNIYSFSPDGRVYITLATRAKAVFLAAGGATKFGLGVFGLTNNLLIALSANYFRVTLP